MDAETGGPVFRVNDRIIDGFSSCFRLVSPVRRAEDSAVVRDLVGEYLPGVFSFLSGEFTSSMLLSRLGSFSHIQSSVDLPARLQQGNGQHAGVYR